MSGERYSKTIIHQSAAAATADGTVANVQGYTSGVVQITGSFTATVTFEGSQDGSTWVALALADLNSTTRARATSASGAGMWLLDDVGGLRKFRARVTWTSGTSVSVRSVWVA